MITWVALILMKRHERSLSESAIARMHGGDLDQDLTGSLRAGLWGILEGD
jgi:hypothetical protein